MSEKRGEMRRDRETERQRERLGLLNGAAGPQATRGAICDLLWVRACNASGKRYNFFFSGMERSRNAEGMLLLRSTERQTLVLSV